MCRLPEKGWKEIEEIEEEMKERDKDDDDDEFRFNDASTHEGHLRQNGELTWFCSETIIMMS